MADGGDRPMSAERPDDDILEHGALQIGAHPPRPVPTGEQQRLDVAGAHGIPPYGRPERRVFDQFGVRRPSVPVRPQHPADPHHMRKPRYEPPRVEATPGDHELVATGRLA